MTSSSNMSMSSSININNNKEERMDDSCISSSSSSSRNNGYCEDKDDDEDALDLVISTSEDAISSEHYFYNTSYNASESPTDFNEREAYYDIATTTTDTTDKDNNKEEASNNNSSNTTKTIISSAAAATEEEHTLVEEQTPNPTASSSSSSIKKKSPNQASNSKKLLPPRVNFHNGTSGKQQQQHQQHFFSLVYDSDEEKSAGSNASLVFSNPNAPTNQIVPTHSKNSATAAAMIQARHQQQQQQKRKYMPTFVPQQLLDCSNKTTPTNNHVRVSSMDSVFTLTDSEVSISGDCAPAQSVLSVADTTSTATTGGVPTTIITASNDNNTFDAPIELLSPTSSCSSSALLPYPDRLLLKQRQLQQQQQELASSIDLKNTPSLLWVDNTSVHGSLFDKLDNDTITAATTTIQNKEKKQQLQVVLPATAPIATAKDNNAIMQKNTLTTANIGSVNSNKYNTGNSGPRIPPRLPLAVSTPQQQQQQTSKTAPGLTDYLARDISDFLKSNTSTTKKNPNMTARDNKNIDVVAKQKQKFHERNQSFLKQQTHQQHHRISSPTARSTSPSTSSLLLLSKPHRRLSSIDNDNWEDDSKVPTTSTTKAIAKSSSSSFFTSSSDSNDETTSIHAEAITDEKTFLLLPSHKSNSKSKQRQKYGTNDITTFLSSSSSSCNTTYSASTGTTSPTTTTTTTTTTTKARSIKKKKKKKKMDKLLLLQEENYSRHSIKKKTEKLRRKMEQRAIKKLNKSKKQQNNDININQQNNDNEGNYSSANSFASSSSSSSSSSGYFHNNNNGYNEAYILKKSHKRALKYEAERNAIIEQWKAEAKAELLKAKEMDEYLKWYNQLYRWIYCKMRIMFLIISNFPSQLGGIALAVTTLGIVWFKFAEENLTGNCHPVHYHSNQCQFPEFPGCFHCENLLDPYYRLALGFHYTCSSIGAVLILCMILKIFFAFSVVVDELSSPTTSSPAGLLCMTLVCVFSSFGNSAKFVVLTAAFFHLLLVMWFNYMALSYKILPDPSWYPNTVGVGLSAVKTWLFYPWAGHFLMALSLGLNCMLFPIAVFRVFVNEKISATVCWIQMSAPAVSLYALTIMAQPSFQEEQPDVSAFDRIQRAVYLPFMHIMFALALIGVISGVHSLWVRWDVMKSKSFGPAHAAFPFPLLAHVNAIQAYRAAVDTFSNPSPMFHHILYAYWLFMLLVGTVLTVVVTVLFLYYLPSWTHVDVTDEDEPPAPNATVMAEIINTGFFEGLREQFVSPAVLQANETGVLVREARSGNIIRSRRIYALGFDPTMSWSEMNEAREAMLQWVAKNPPRHRNNTLSVPGIRVENFGKGNLGVYNDLEANFGALGYHYHPLGSNTSSHVSNNRPRASSADVLRSYKSNRGANNI